MGYAVSCERTTRVNQERQMCNCCLARQTNMFLRRRAEASAATGFCSQPHSFLQLAGQSRQTYSIPINRGWLVFLDTCRCLRVYQAAAVEIFFMDAAVRLRMHGWTGEIFEDVYYTRLSFLHCVFKMSQLWLALTHVNGFWFFLAEM